MKRTISIVLVLLLITTCLMCFCSCKDKGLTIDSSNPFLLKIASSQKEFDLDSEIKITVSYGWIGSPTVGGVGDIEGLLWDHPIQMSFTVANYVIADCDEIFNLADYLVKEIDNINQVKYKIVSNTDSYEFSYTEELILPRDLFCVQSGQIKFEISGWDSQRRYVMSTKINYQINDNILTIDEENPYQKLFEKNTITYNDPQNTINVYYHELGFNCFSGNALVRNSSLTINSEPMYFTDKNTLKQYLLERFVGLYVDSQGNYLSNYASNNFSGCNDKYFENHYLIIVEEMTNNEYFYIEKTFIHNNNKLTVVKSSNTFANNQEDRALLTILVYEIDKERFGEDVVMEIDEIYVEEDWINHFNK